MDVGIIGAGNVGTGSGKRLATVGHRIVVSFARSQEKLEAAANAIGDGNGFAGDALQGRASS